MTPRQASQEDTITVDTTGLDTDQSYVQATDVSLPESQDGSRSEIVPWPLTAFIGAALDNPGGDKVDVQANRAVADPSGRPQHG